MQKQRDGGLSFCRVLCTLGIIVYHFGCHLPQNAFRPLYEFRNGDWGSVLVTLFFMLSGAVLYLNYGQGWKMGQTLRFWARRWVALFPLYYLTYLCCEILNMLRVGDIFYRGSPLPYLFTLVGMDGYLANRATTYYLVGEWFTGALVLLYLLFPLIIWCFCRRRALTCLLCTGLYFGALALGSLTGFWPFLCCLLCFVLGMALVRLLRLLTLPVALGCCGVCVLLLLVPLPLHGLVCSNLMGLALFIPLWLLGRRVTAHRLAARVVGWLDRLSLATFLIHHTVIVAVLTRITPTGVWRPLLVLALTVPLIVLLAHLLTTASNWLVAGVKRVF